MTELRLPYITSPTPQGQVAQIRSYLQQLIPDLQYALDNIESSIVAASEEKPQASKASKDAHTGVRRLKDEDAFAVRSRFKQFVEGGTGVQTFLIFGASNGTIINGVALLTETGTAAWQGTEGVVVTTLAGGILAVALPNKSSDIITVISGQKFNV